MDREPGTPVAAHVPGRRLFGGDDDAARDHAARKAEHTAASAQLARARASLATREALTRSRGAAVRRQEAAVARLRELKGSRSLPRRSAG